MKARCSCLYVYMSPRRCSVPVFKVGRNFRIAPSRSSLNAAEKASVHTGAKRKRVRPPPPLLPRFDYFTPPPLRNLIFVYRPTFGASDVCSDKMGGYIHYLPAPRRNYLRPPLTGAGVQPIRDALSISAFFHSLHSVARS